MADFSSIPNFHLKIVFIAHFMLISFGSMGYWSSGSYLFYNFILILTLLWSIHRHDADEPLQMAIFINGISIILDIILLAMRFPDDHSASERFSAAMAILHLIVRPFSALYLAKLLQERSGASGGVGNLFSGPRNRSYEDIDRNAPANSNQGGYDFSTAQQI
ncbi:hypothetical protein ILUMI_23459 [Ignelater luminosus]|uniref:Type-1 angiotensin II receptor-associated protein n=1 Tax=Ignelater luminosus TaxID=2038154 RepID=A0A8K0CC10_IGNLU|nr:hypothetical protein ILUMI_23459 [Ignelater luminosus]